jgi:glycosyltransferase involved in cell wall biosynthesis
MRRILFLITTLDVGGAEIMLHRVLSRLDPRRFETTVVSLAPHGEIADRIASLGIGVTCLGMRSPAHSFQLLNAWRIAREFNPDIIHGWLLHGSLLSSVIGRGLHRGVKVAWGIHYSLNDVGRKGVSGPLLRVGKYLAATADCIVYCSERSATQHAAIGYPSTQAVVIPNGFDCDHFRPEPTVRESWRASMGISESVPVIGLIARYDPAKDLGTFLRAAAITSQRFKELRFVIAGNKMPEHVTDEVLREHGLQQCVSVLGQTPEPRQIYRALDIATLASSTEGFPNVIGEAMACGVPCVVTDVGDCALLVGDTGSVVRPGEPAALADAWTKLLTMTEGGRKALGEAARERILGRFSIDSVVRRYAEVYDAL